MRFLVPYIPRLPTSQLSMDVTKQNFNEVLPTVLEKLQTCKFVSLDLEMSGIYSTDRSKRIRKDDTPAQRYSKMIGPATTYSIIQFGLSIFHESEDGGFCLMLDTENIAFLVY